LAAQRMRIGTESNDQAHVDGRHVVRDRVRLCRSAPRTAGRKGMGASEIAKALKIGRASVSRRQARLPPDVGNCDPGHLVRPPTGVHGPRRRRRVLIQHQATQNLDCEAMRQQDRLGASVRRARQHLQRPALLGGQAIFEQVSLICRPPPSRGEGHFHGDADARRGLAISGLHSVLWDWRSPQDRGVAGRERGTIAGAA
jgi:hypothetical protein